MISSHRHNPLYPCELNKCTYLWKLLSSFTALSFKWHIMHVCLISWHMYNTLAAHHSVRAKERQTDRKANEEVSAGWFDCAEMCCYFSKAYYITKYEHIAALRWKMNHVECCWGFLFGSLVMAHWMISVLPMSGWVKFFDTGSKVIGHWGWSLLTSACKVNIKRRHDDNR